jgi:putative transposase
MYGEGKFSDSKVINEINKLLTDRVKKQPGFAQMNQLSSRVAQNALIDLKDAFNMYRLGQSGHPTLASRHSDRSLTVDSSGKVVLDAGYTIKIAKLGTFRLHEPWDGGLVSQQTFTISKEGSLWFVSFCVDAERLPVQQPKKILGVDRGIKSFATLSEAEGSNNQVFEAPGPLKQGKTKLATWQRQASRQARGYNNQPKTYPRITRLHAGISCLRKDFLNKLTTYLAKSFKLIKIEDLNVKGMMANHKLAGAISDLGLYEFKPQLTYNCLMYMATRVLVDPGFPSYLTCSNCGQKQDRPLSIRTYNSHSGGVSIDRDLNTSIHILNREPSAARGIAY